METWRDMSKESKDNLVVWTINTLKDRLLVGEEKYNSETKGFRGDPLDHAIEEAFDIMVYLYFAKLRQVYETKPKTDGQSLRDTIFTLLKDRDVPMHRYDILENLKAADIAVGGEFPINTMTAHMSNDSRFVSEGEGKWGLKEWEAGETATIVSKDGDILNGTCQGAICNYLFRKFIYDAETGNWICSHCGRIHRLVSGKLIKVG